MRLIDADALKQDLRKCQIESLIAHTEEKNVFDIINEQPTAYDVEKVEGKIKELAVKKLGEIRAKDVLDIVEKGGVQ